MTFVQNTIYAF